MPTPEYQLTCTKNVKIAHEVYDFRFNRPTELEFEAGQFVLFDFPLLNDPTDIQTRAFSIASSPTENELIFVAKLIENGRASNWIEQSLKPGDTLRTQGPFGRFVLDDNATNECLFICTSTGIAPFRSQIIAALARGSTRKMDLIFGARHEKDLFWQDELDELQKQPNFTVHYILSQPTDNWQGRKGHVQDLIPDISKDLSSTDVYICGNPDMTDELKKLCLESWGVEKNKLHVEGYI